MKQHNYKAGDKVRIIGNGDAFKTCEGIHHNFRIGEVVRVLCIDSDYLVCDNDGLTQCISPQHAEPVTFSRDDIKAGYLLEVEDGRDGTTFYMTVVPSARVDAVLGCCCPDKHWWPLSCFDEDTLVYRGPAFTATILRVYGRTNNRLLLANTPANRKLLWEREKKPEAVKMTVAEISEKLGYDVEIVKEG